MGVSSRYIPDVREVKAFRAHRSPIHIAQQLGGGNFTTFISFIALFYDTEMHSRGITNIIKLGIAFAGKHVKIREVR